MKDSICKHNWINKGVYKQCTICGAIDRSQSFVPINGLIFDSDTDTDHSHQSEDEVEQ